MSLNAELSCPYCVLIGRREQMFCILWGRLSM